MLLSLKKGEKISDCRYLQYTLTNIFERLYNSNLYVGIFQLQVETYCYSILNKIFMILLIPTMEISGNYGAGVYIDKITEGPDNIFTHILKIPTLGLVFPFLYSRVPHHDLEDTFDNYGIST